ncbi:MAG: DUF4391 domain-containing protein [Alkaliphilus sp.]
MNLLYESMNIPKNCEVGNTVFKKLFYENASMSLRDKETFKEHIKKITWLYSFKNRVDGISKVTGEAIYPQDIYFFGEMLYGKTLRSSRAHANIELDTSSAEQIEGVVKILTYKDVVGKNHHVYLLF